MVRDISLCAAEIVFLQPETGLMPEENIQISPVQELLAIAKEYCWLLEHVKDFETEKVLEFMRKILPLLYVKGSMIVVPEGADEADMQRYVTEENYEIIFNEVRNKIKQTDLFYVFNHELKEPEERSMAECLTDIYQDLKDVMIAYGRGLEAEMAGAILCLQQWYVGRWGAQAALLMPVLHRIFENNNTQIQTGTEFD